MKYLIYSFIGLSFFILCACEKGDPEIAPTEELSAISYNENFVCQPIDYDDHLVALINRNNATSLCNYDDQGNRLWQNSVDQYIISGYNFNTIQNVGLNKSRNGEIILNMFVADATNKNYQIIKAIDFDASGNVLWQRQDVIHQPDTIIIQTDTIGLKNKFIAAGMVHISNGTHIMVSSQITESLDSSYIQLSTYNNSGVFINDSYLKIAGARYIKSVFLSSDDHLILLNSINSKVIYSMMALKGNIIFELTPPVPTSVNYFFYENKLGNFIVSDSYFDTNSNLKGSVFSFDKLGNVLWTNNMQDMQTTIMTSVHEKSGAYIFGGFNTASVLTSRADWRTTFSQNKYDAVFQKTDLDGQEIWFHSLLITDNTVGAACIGINQISFFSGKFQNTVKNIVLLKLDDEGNILN